MTKFFRAFLVILVLISCGPKPGTSVAEIKRDVDAYVSKVDNNHNLKKETIDGALTDTDGFKDIGTFNYTVYFEDGTNELYKIKNVETTDTTISETYYFRAGKLVYIATNLGGGTHKMYVHKNKFISENPTDGRVQKLLLDKAKRFQNSFNKDH